VANDATSADLHGPIRRDQASRTAAATRLRHPPEGLGIGAERPRDLALVMSGQSEIKAPHRPGVDATMPEQSTAADAIEGRVTAEPRR